MPSVQLVGFVGHGGLDMLRYCDDIPTPVAPAGEVLVRVGPQGVNNTDMLPPRQDDPKVPRADLVPSASRALRTSSASPRPPTPTTSACWRSTSTSRCSTADAATSSATAAARPYMTEVQRILAEVHGVSERQRRGPRRVRIVSVEAVAEK